MLASLFCESRTLNFGVFSNQRLEVLCENTMNTKNQSVLPGSICQSGKWVRAVHLATSATQHILDKMQVWNMLKRENQNFTFLICLFLETGGGRDRERNIDVWLPLTRPYWGPGPPPRHVPWLGMEPTALWFAGRHSIHWATPARARIRTLECNYRLLQ